MFLTVLCYWSFSTGAGAAVWEGASVTGGAEDAAQAAAGWAEGGADVQTQCSHWGGTTHWLCKTSVQVCKQYIV